MNKHKFPTSFSVTAHTEHVGPGSTFFAIQGAKKSGLVYIADAIARGARTIVVQKGTHLIPSIHCLIAEHRVKVVYVADARVSLAEYSAHAYRSPARKLKIIGVTGTKGKTSSVFLLHHIFTHAGYTTAMLSTAHNQIGQSVFDAPLTTPQPDYIHAFLAACVERGVTHVIMEVAAQALSMHRVHGIEFDAGLFTNFAAEHGEFYPSMDEYFAAKCKLFDQIRPDGPVVLNRDDQWLRRTCIEQTRVVWFSLLDQTVEYSAAQLLPTPQLPGVFNQYNVLGVIALATQYGIASDSIADALEICPSVPGRLQVYQLPNGAQCFIDYAHNPSSYQAVLSTLARMTEHLILVFGCGGERDPHKRPIMGRIASEYAQVIVLTSDDPRSESPESIVADIARGINTAHSQLIIEYDRAHAIHTAYRYAHPGSIIALLGKGTSRVQHIGTVRHYFNEDEIVRSLGQDTTS